MLIVAFFVIPIIEFEGQSHYLIFDPARMRTSGAWVARNTIEPWQFIKDKVEKNGVSFVVGIPTLVMLAISVLAYRHIDKKYKDFYITNLILGIISLYMCTKFFPWSLMPQILTNIQYAWRLEGLGIFFLIPVMVMNVYYLLQCMKNEKIRNVIYILIIIVLGIFTVLELKVYQTNCEGKDIEYEEKIKSNPVISHFNVNRDYLPLKAGIEQSGYMLEREDKVYILQGKAIIENEEKYALAMSFDIKQTDEGTVLELPYLYYPGYTVELLTEENKKELGTTESDKGFLQVVIPNNVEKGTITINYTGTTLEKVSYIISAVSFILFIVYIISFKKKQTFGEKNEK